MDNNRLGKTSDAKLAAWAGTYIQRTITFTKGGVYYISPVKGHIVNMVLYGGGVTDASGPDKKKKQKKNKKFTKLISIGWWLVEWASLSLSNSASFPTILPLRWCSGVISYSMNPPTLTRVRPYEEQERMKIGGTRWALPCVFRVHPSSKGGTKRPDGDQSAPWLCAHKVVIFISSVKELWRNNSRSIYINTYIYFHVALAQQNCSAIWKKRSQILFVLNKHTHITFISFWFSLSDFENCLLSSSKVPLNSTFFQFFRFVCVRFSASVFVVCVYQCGRRRLTLGNPFWKRQREREKKKIKKHAFQKKNYTWKTPWLIPPPFRFKCVWAVKRRSVQKKKNKTTKTAE